MDFVCPNCGAVHKLPAVKRLPTALQGKAFRCSSCGEKFYVTAEQVGLEQSVLDEFEGVLQRMIGGVFLFTFVRLPQELWTNVVRWFPCAVKLVRVVALLLLWLALTAGPFSSIFVARTMWLEKNEGIAGWYNAHHTGWDAILCLWSALASIASVWGYLYYRRQSQPKSADRPFWRALGTIIGILLVLALVFVAIASVVRLVKTRQATSFNVRGDARCDSWRLQGFPRS